MDYKELFGEELATKLEEVIKEKNINLIVDDKEKPSFIPKTRFDEVIGTKNELKTQVGALSNELETLKKSAKGNEELTKAIEELQSKNQDWENKYNKNLIDNAVKLEALHNKALDPTDLSKFLDYTQLQLDETGAVKGLTEQIAKLKETKGYLFEVAKQANNNTPANPLDVKIVKDIEEQYQDAIKNQNMPLAIHLKNKMIFGK
jgi:Phage minor structural protein GP20